jgi:hypothetical protein
LPFRRPLRRLRPLRWQNQTNEGSELHWTGLDWTELTILRFARWLHRGGTAARRHFPRDPSEFRSGLDSAKGVGGTAVRLLGRMGFFLDYLFLFAVRSLLRFWSISFLFLLFF